MVARPKTTLKRPCKACPFMKSSAPGWLGPYSGPEELHRRITANPSGSDEVPFSCHKTIEQDGQPAGETELCVGSILYARKACKRFSNPWLEGQMDRISTDTPDHVKAEVMSLPEFFAHHARTVDL